MVISKKIIISATVAATLILGGAGYAFFGNNGDKPAPTDTSQENSQNDTPAPADSQGQPQAEPLPTKPDVGTPSPSPTGKVNVTLSHLSQDASTVYVRAFVEGVTGGTCTVKFEKSGSSGLEQSASLAATGETYTCQGFNVSKSRLPSKGSWNVKVSFSGSGKTGSSATQSINIQ